MPDFPAEYNAYTPLQRVFLDTEFTGLQWPTSLISIGLAAENGWMYYGELTDWDQSQRFPWLDANVVPALSGRLRSCVNAKTEGCMYVRGDKTDLSRSLRNWFALFGASKCVEIWADVLAWDWVLFCDMFGSAFDIPPQIHHIPLDLSTCLAVKGIDPDTTRETLGSVDFTHPDLRLQKHHALYDALLEKDVFQRLVR